MNSKLFRTLNVLILAGLASCSSLVPSPTLTPTPTSTATLTPPPTATQTLTPTITATPEPASGFLTQAILESRRWGNLTFKEIREGVWDGYYEGQKLEDIEFYADGTTKLLYKGEELWVADQSVQMIDGELWLGLFRWDKDKKGLDTPQSESALGIVDGIENEVENEPSLTLILADNKNTSENRPNIEREQRLIESTLKIGSMVMTETPGYDPRSEFDDIDVVDMNGNVIKDINVRPKNWMFINWSKWNNRKNGTYLFRATSPYETVSFHEMHTTPEARPMQIALGNGWFRVRIINADGSEQQPTYYVPIVAMNADGLPGSDEGSLVHLNGLLRKSGIEKTSHLFSKEKRGNFFFWLINQKTESETVVVDRELKSLHVRVNRNFFDGSKCPELNDRSNIMRSLPTNLDEALMLILVIDDAL